MIFVSRNVLKGKQEILHCILKYNRKIVKEATAISLTHKYMTFTFLCCYNHSDTSNTQIHDRPLSWVVTITAIPLAHKYMTVHFPGLLQSQRYL